ncbi:hypothetical protein OG21DRAFT_1514975 [Imleria badia]|nr:hypothetical protein OG21DRAFT_1514975 [Imleria badia]
MGPLVLSCADAYRSSQATLGSQRDALPFVCMLGALYRVQWYLAIHESLHPMAPSHTQYAPAPTDPLIVRHWSLLLLWGLSSAACVTGSSFLGTQLARPQCLGPKSPLGFCPNH